MQLQVIVADLQRRGREAQHDLAAVYRALSDAPGATPGLQRAAGRALAQLLDDEMGAVGMAVQVRREMAPRLAGADRSQARLDVLADLIELGRSEEALVAAQDCVRECEGDQRIFGLVLQARLLSEAGRIAEARAAYNAARVDASANRKTAFLFASRADAFLAHGQHARARAAAELSLALDPTGLQAPALRRKFE